MAIIYKGLSTLQTELAKEKDILYDELKILLPKTKELEIQLFLAKKEYSKLHSRIQQIKWAEQKYEKVVENQ